MEDGAAVWENQRPLSSH